jgi:DUF1680 family protein
VIVLHGKGVRRAPWEGEVLYRPVEDEAAVDVAAIPYYAWDHREAGEMVVWLPETTGLAEDRATADR